MRWLLILVIFIPGLLIGQTTPWGTANPRDISLGYQTTGDGLYFRGSGAPTFTPSSNQFPFLYIDTVNKIQYMYVGNWSRVTPKYSALPPKPTYGNYADSSAMWISSVDSNSYTFSHSISAWVPSTGVFFGSMIPSDVAATDSTGAVVYTKTFWQNLDTDSMLVYNNGVWKYLGALVSGGDDWGAQVVETESTIDGDGTVGNPIGINTTNTRTALSVGTYKNDSDAQTGGVVVGEWYYLSQDNTLGLSPGTIRKRLY